MKIINLAQEKSARYAKARELTALVNPLVEEAFGARVRGDIFGTSYNAGDTHVNSKGVVLGYIGKGGFDFESRGHFFADATGLIERDYSKRDGSVITVPAKYEAQARKYAELYEKKVGKEVTIRIE